MSTGLKKINRAAFIIPEDLTWEGYKNYLINLITSLDKFAKKKKIFIFCGKDKYVFIKNLKIKNIEVVYFPFFNYKGILSYIKKFFSFFFNKYDPIIFYLVKKYKINLISHYKPLKFVKTLVWFPDFQHLFLKKNFLHSEIVKRNNLYSNYINNADIHLVSSYDAKKHLISFNKKNCKKKLNVKVLKFEPKINFEEIMEKKRLLKKYNINKNYIFIPNQFWKHKNHKLIITCMKNLKKKNIKIQFVFTGSNQDHRFPNYFKDLLKFIKKENLQDYFKYLGLIKHSDVISLMYHCNLFINPSLFEGWSSTVQEAKVFNKTMLLSNIEIHKEQAGNNAIYFDPCNANKLTKIITKNFLKRKTKKTSLETLKKKYEIKRRRFGENYFRIINYNYE